jgi:hypothetical protein
MREWVRDSNAVAQDKAVEACCKVVEMGGKTLKKLVLSLSLSRACVRAEVDEGVIVSF